MVRWVRERAQQRRAHTEAARGLDTLEAGREYWEGYIALLRPHGAHPQPPAPPYTAAEHERVCEALGALMQTPSTSPPDPPAPASHTYRGILVEDPFSDRGRSVDLVGTRPQMPQDSFRVWNGYVTRHAHGGTQVWMDPDRELERTLFEMLLAHGHREQLRELKGLPWSA